MINIPIYRDAGGRSLVRMRREHLAWIELKEPELQYERDMPGLRQYLADNADPNASWTGLRDGKIIVCFGIRHAWPGVGDLWMMPSRHIDAGTISLVRYGRKMLSELLDSGAYARLHIQVRADNDIAFRFAKALGFEVECRMRKFGHDGVDCYMMARISDHGIS